MSEKSYLLEQSWNEFHLKIQDLRTLMENDKRFLLSDQVQAQAYAYLFQLQAAAYNICIGMRIDFPRFYTQQVLEPIYPWLAPNPDFIYSRGLFNPRRSYRISGRIGDLKMIVIQLQSTLFDYGMERLGDYEISDFILEEGGKFTIIASPEPHQGNWIRLDPSHTMNMISVRRAMGKFDDDIGDIAIEALDNKPEMPFERSPLQLIERINYATRMVEFTTREITLKLYHQTNDKAEINKPWVHGGRDSASASIGGADLATYCFINFAIASDEALIIEADIPPCRYWGSQLNDVWVQTLDYAHHQSSLSMGQATLDKDGRVRYVISASDPGVANWLDTVGNTHGLAILRWYDVQTQPAVRTKKVPLADVMIHLPSDTTMVSAEQRVHLLRERQRSVYTIYST